MKQERTRKTPNVWQACVILVCVIAAVVAAIKTGVGMVDKILSRSPINFLQAAEPAIIQKVCHCEPAAGWRGNPFSLFLIRRNFQGGQSRPPLRRVYRQITGICGGAHGPRPTGFFIDRPRLRSALHSPTNPHKGGQANAGNFSAGAAL